MAVMLSERQREILRLVVEEYVGTVLAELEQLGLLTHPHTSAGRVPTESGYRYYAGEVLRRPARRGIESFALDPTTVRSEVEAALRATTEMLAGATRLLALVSAPPLETTTVRHVEVLLLQPHVVMCVVITATGDVSKRTCTFERPVDPGPVEWAAQYLNEQLAGLQLGTVGLRRRFEDESLGAVERAFLQALKPTFTDLLGSDEQRVFVGGAANLLADARREEREAAQQLLEALERRGGAPPLLRRPAPPKRPF